MNDGVWTDVMVAYLRDAWERGDSGSVIGAALGVTKNAVIGKRRRLGLPDRPNPSVSKTPKTNKEPAPTPAPALAPDVGSVAPAPDAPQLRLVKPSPPGPVPAAPASPPRGKCCWPMWGFREDPTHRYCEAPRDIAGGPYCTSHRAVAFVQRPARTA